MIDILNYADTIGQFKILSYIKQRYVYQAIENRNLKLEKVDRNTIRIVDINGDSITFYYDEINRTVTEIENR